MNPALAIRIAMLGGVLLFGGATLLLRRTGSVSAAPDPSVLVLGGRIVWVVALAGCGVLFLRAGRATKTPQRFRLSIVAWALGEMVALYGAALYFLTGLSTWYLLGVGFLVMTFLAFPAGREASGS